VRAPEHHRHSRPAIFDAARRQRYPGDRLGPPPPQHQGLAPIIGWDKAHGRLGLLADDVSVINPYGGRSRVRRDYRGGVMWVDGEPRDMQSRFIPIENVLADGY
jgi:hypothetical protein